MIVNKGLEVGDQWEPTGGIPAEMVGAVGVGRSGQIPDAIRRWSQADLSLVGRGV